MHFGWRWKKQHRLLLSCHQPIQMLEQMHSEGHAYSSYFQGLAAADVVAVLSETQVDGYKRYAPNADVSYIPLGVDTEFFKPDPHQRAHYPLVLTIGSWLRDYTCWAKVAEEVSAKHKDIEFVVIANKEAIARAQLALGNTEVHVRFLTGISDEALRKLYQQASLLFLPLNDAVANNALLEAMASGLPSVVTNLPATREYLSTEGGILVTEHTVSAYADAIHSLLSNESFWMEKSQAALLRVANTFAWQRIADQYRNVYGSLA